MTGQRTFYCSFCGKSQHDVRKIILSACALICDECTDLCHEIVHEQNVVPFSGDALGRLIERVDALEKDVRSSLAVVSASEGTKA